MREIECYQQSFISRCQKQIENWGGECRLVRILTRPLSPKGQTILASPQNPYLVGEEEGLPRPSPSLPGSDAFDQYHYV